MSAPSLAGWERLRHRGLLLDQPRLQRVAAVTLKPLAPFHEEQLRRQAAAIVDGRGDVSAFVAMVLEHVCGFSTFAGTWKRGSAVESEWGRRAVTGETVKPRHLWRGHHGAILPVFIDTEARLGLGKGRKAASQVVQWLRAGAERLALLTNGRQWRLIFAGLDFDAWCEWDVDLWFEEGALSPQVTALCTLLCEALWIPERDGGVAPLLQAILDSRKGQAELSAALGERVREAVELLVQAHGEALKRDCADVDPADIYRAAVRVVMRMVVVLFAESRELLPRDNALYHASYGLGGLLGELERVAARGGNRLARSFSAWPRVLSLFRLVHEGSHHPALLVPAYGGELFAPGQADSPDPLSRALSVFEEGAYQDELLPDREVLQILERITRTRTRVRQGRTSVMVTAPVDFSDLSSEYIGILYEGLLDFELRVAPAGDPIVFLNVGNQPALPLSRLEQMDDKAIANLLEKMKDKGKKSDEEGEGADDGEGAEDEGAEGEEGADDEGDESVSASSDEADEGEDDTAVADERHATRTRAERWARRAVMVGKLVSRKKGKLTPEKEREFDDAVGRKARQLVVKTFLPGEWYLVRWGGTRKGSGTFYTRPGLAVPTTQRTLRPLAWQPPVAPDGSANVDAPAAEWIPRRPEEILAVKVCDPACGSGTFPVAALRFLTDALYASLHHHQRIVADGERSVIRLLGATPNDEADAERLSEELLPSRPDDADFEPRLKAILRRHVVERCIYGVDLDPLAVELCRLALWVETMDRRLPFSFLDHKVKCGNGLVGAWFDQFRHYPAMAWKNREGGDKNHANGVHFAKEVRTKAIGAWVRETLVPDLQAFLAGRTLFSADLQEQAIAVHDEAFATLARVHELPVQDSAERARIYREEVIGSPAYRQLKEAMDLWCACWFWPVEELAAAPVPTRFATPDEETREVAARISARQRFFHWELEFPDVFRTAGSGFDAMLGNPPWETLQPNSKEYFSNIDPLYRAYGKQEALGYQKEYFIDPRVERGWLEYSESFALYSNWMKFAASPFGDVERQEVIGDQFSLGRAKANAELHAHWRSARRRTGGYADDQHPFRHRGEGKAYTYKLFVEQALALLANGGRLGFILPSGLYSDHGSRRLRELLLDRCQWEWLFGFENRDAIFDIHRSFKFNPVIVQKGGTTAAIRTAFMRRKLEDWERGEALATLYSRAQVDRFSPRSKAILEIQSARDLEILEKIYSNSVLLGDTGPDGWGISYAQGDFNMTSDSKLFPPRPKWEEQGYRPDEYSRWLKGDWRPIAELWPVLGVDSTQVVPIDPACEARMQEPDVQRTPWRVRCAQPPYDSLPIPRADIPAGIVLSREADAWIRVEGVEDVALPLLQGVLVNQLEFGASSWRSGTGLQAKWDDEDAHLLRVSPQFLLSPTKAGLNDGGSDWTNRSKVAFRDIARSTDERTCIPALLPDFPCGNVLGVLRPERGSPGALAGFMASLVFDWSLRQRIGGTHINWYIAGELPLPSPNTALAALIAHFALRLSARGVMCASAWTRGQMQQSSAALGWRELWAMTQSERFRLTAILDASAAYAMGLDRQQLLAVLEDCFVESGATRSGEVELDPKGFWRIDRSLDVEVRRTFLAVVAFAELERLAPSNVRATSAYDISELAILLERTWLLPGEVTLAEYLPSFGADAERRRSLAPKLGRRFLDWQVAQGAEESWRECESHQRNLLAAKALERHALKEKRADGVGAAESQVVEKQAKPQHELFS